MTGVYAKKAAGPATIGAGWFRYRDNGAASVNAVGGNTVDLYVLDAKVAMSKAATVGASYYYNNDRAANTKSANVHTVGVNAVVNAGPATINPFGAYQFGKDRLTAGKDLDINSFMVGTTAKVKAGAVGVNVAAIYLSGDASGNDGDAKNWRGLSYGGASTRNMTYFGPANSWLLVRNAAAVNSSTSVLDNDLTVGGRGLYLVSGGIDGAAGKTYFGANAIYGHTAKERSFVGGQEDGNLGTEINATVGYKLYDNMKVSLNGAYMFLGAGLNSTVNCVGGVNSASDPWMGNVMVQYTF
jgi:hypothetical protein